MKTDDQSIPALIKMFVSATLGIEGRQVLTRVS